MSEQKYHYFQDPGHGWIRVTKSKLVKLNIHEKISRYSYMKGTAVYLEEDSDAPKFLRALEKKGETYELIEHHTNRQSQIRNYHPYIPTPKEAEP